jgi:serine/threonine protein kinase
MRQVSSAVGSAHARGVIHQDLKPGNIRLTPNAEAVVLDFGVARITGESCGGRPEASGTPAYMSPEQIRGEAIDARSDIYALAMTLYKTLTGHHPFETAADLEQLLEWQVERAPPSPADFNPHLPGALADTILQGLAKDPRERFRACADFTRAVSVSLGMDDGPPVAQADGRWDPRARVRLGARLVLPGDDVFNAQVVDLSTSGAALRVSRPLREGSILGIVIRVPLKGSEHLVRCSVRVVRVTPYSDGQGFRVGVAFEALGHFDRAVLSDLVRAVLVYNSSR